jgi:hypothetical protein
MSFWVFITDGTAFTVGQSLKRPSATAMTLRIRPREWRSPLHISGLRQTGSGYFWQFCAILCILTNRSESPRGRLQSSAHPDFPESHGRSGSFPSRGAHCPI